MKRRNIIVAAILLLAVMALVMGATAQQPTIKIGVMHALSGTMAISETTLKDTILMLVDDQNKKGGVLGRKLEAVVVEDEDPAGSPAIGGAEGGDVDPIGTAVDRMGSRVLGLPAQGFGLDHLDQLGFPRIGLGVQDVNTGRVDSRHHQIAPFDVGVRRPGAQTRATSIPPEMVQLVAPVRHVELPDHPAKRFRAGFHVDRANGIGPRLSGAQHRKVG